MSMRCSYKNSVGARGRSTRARGAGSAGVRGVGANQCEGWQCERTRCPRADVPLGELRKARKQPCHPSLSRPHQVSAPHVAVRPPAVASWAAFCLNAKIADYKRPGENLRAKARCPSSELDQAWEPVSSRDSMPTRRTILCMAVLPHPQGAVGALPIFHQAVHSFSCGTWMVNKL